MTIRTAQLDLRGLIPLISSIPATERGKLLDACETAGRLSVTDFGRATEELEAHNVTRRTVWRDQAAILPIARGTAYEVFRVLFACLNADFRDRQARRIEIEEVKSVAVSDDTARRLAELSPGMRDDFERNFAKHSGGSAAPVRKLVISVHFQGSFGQHEVMRVGDGEFMGMPCSVLIGDDAKLISVAATGAGRASGLGWLGGLLAFVAVVAAIGALMVWQSSPDASPGAASAPVAAATFDARVVPPGVYIRSARVKPGVLDSSRTTLQLGRLFLAADFVAGATPVVVLSDGAWNAHFGSRVDLLGSTITIDGVPTTVVGIARPRPNASDGAGLWIPEK